MRTRFPGFRSIAEPETDERSIDRIVAFSDAIMSIAITLLIVEVSVPVVQEEGDLGQALAEGWREYFGFVLSFTVIGLYWVAHHRIFRHVVRYDGTLIALNLALLLCIAFVPFPTAVLGDYPDVTPAVIAYAATLSATGIAWAVLWRYISHDGRHLDDRLSDRQVRYVQLRALAVPAAFLPSIPIALVDAWAGQCVWILAIGFQLILRRLYPERLTVRSADS